ncbi:uncharacterized protein Mis12 [Fopius arisanus]|uniref:Uncharacterized protein Mis12 n=1 Tax=Fopius arisanus TaxID=64838 RepID=A0A9R1TTZ9_9HYME|nr:PREDICTED: uncharacterized protein LOC105273959 [Fopius arisanus]
MKSSAELEKRKREEYEMQLFGFHSRIVYDTLLSLIQEEIQLKCQQLTETIKQKYNPDEESLRILLKDEKKLTKCYYRATRTQLPALENCVSKIISVPSHVLLDEDKVQAVQYSDRELREKQEKLENLQKRLKKAVAFNAVLKDELTLANDFENKTENTDMLCKMIGDASQGPDYTKTLLKLFGTYQDLKKQLLSVREAPDIHEQRISHDVQDEFSIDDIHNINY